MRRYAAVTAALVAAAVPLVAPAAATAAPPAGACRNVDPPQGVVSRLPWAQQLLDLRRTWPHSTGAGVTVAVVDSGVDADHPQLSGKVLPGRDFYLAGELPGNFDCVSHGTAAASIIAASPAGGVGFRGVAPDARILPVRITDRDLTDSGNPTPINPDAVAAGIRFAVDQGAAVVNLSLSGYGDFTVIRDAVSYARSKDVLLVAAVGNREEMGAAPSFPAAYEGVLGVGAIDIEGARVDGSQVGSYVDLVAPGKDVVGASRASGHAYWTGTSFAAPFVSAAAALVRSVWPDLTAQQVAHRLLATANPARGGHGSPEYGAGIVDPYRAVTEGLSDREPVVLPAVVPAPPDEDAARNAAWWARTGTGARVTAVLAVLAIAVVVVLAVTLPRGRRRRWAPARAVPLPDARPVGEPPDQVFLFPSSTADLSGDMSTVDRC